jgi:hypothetical protein
MFQLCFINYTAWTAEERHVTHQDHVGLIKHGSARRDGRRGTRQPSRPVQHADGYDSFTPRNNSRECPDVTNVSAADGTSLQQGTRTGGSNQNVALTAQC